MHRKTNSNKLPHIATNNSKDTSTAGTNNITN